MEEEIKKKKKTYSSQLNHLEKSGQLSEPILRCAGKDCGLLFIVVGVLCVTQILSCHNTTTTTTTTTEEKVSLDLHVFSPCFVPSE